MRFGVFLLTFLARNRFVDPKYKKVYQVIEIITFYSGLDSIFMTIKKSKVVVVGAGLAGSEAAMFLANAGVEVILLENKTINPTKIG